MPDDHATGIGTRPVLLVVDLSARAAQGMELEAILRSCFEVKRFCPAPGVAGSPRSFHEEPGGSTPSFLPDVIVVVACTRESEIEGAIESLVMQFSGPPIVLVTESSDPAAILRFLRCGVADFIIPPLSEVQVLPRVLRLLGGQDRRSRLAMRMKLKLGLKHLVGESPAFQTAIEDLPILAKCDATVLIDGETGTGKEVCARAIHYLSPRAGHPFVPVNCGAIPLELLENELFGHEGEAYTGATGTRPGLIHETQGGTLFLDEIDCLPLGAQVKLLRLLHDKEYRRLGSSKMRQADVRLIAATNADVEEAVRVGRLRRDFYYRLNVLRLRLPPLRERSGDVVLLARHFLGKYATKLGQPIPTLTACAIQALSQHDWPGNVRELEHVMERAVVVVEDRRFVRASDVQIPGVRAEEAPSFKQAKARAVARFERTYLENLLAAHEGNITHAARTARKQRRALWELIRKHGIDAQRFQSTKLG